MRKFTKYPQGYIKASQNWREKTECKSRNGKIVRMQNVSNSFNDQDYYVLFDADGNFVEKSLDFNYLHKKLYGSTDIYADDEDSEPSIAELMNEPIGDSGEPWEGDVDNFRQSVSKESVDDENIENPLRDSEIETVERSCENIRTTLDEGRIRRKINNLLHRPHTEEQERWLKEIRNSLNM